MIAGHELPTPGLFLFFGKLDNSTSNNELIHWEKSVTHVSIHLTSWRLFLYTALLISSSFLALALRNCRSLGSESSPHNSSQTSFSFPQSIYFLLDYHFFVCVAALLVFFIDTSLLFPLIWLLLSTELDLGFCLTYDLQWMRATVLAHFSVAVRTLWFAGAEDKAVHRSSIQMDRGFPGLPRALVHRQLFPIVWP